MEGGREERGGGGKEEGRRREGGGRCVLLVCFIGVFYCRGNLFITLNLLVPLVFISLRLLSRNFNL